jgi:acetyl-CoA carboxylase carboxyl transferase subunit alpha
MDVTLDFEKPIAALEKRISELKELSQKGDVNFKAEIKDLEEKRDNLITSTYKNLSPWQRVQLSRHPLRPHTKDYIARIFEDFIELHGDRYFGDDAAMITGLGTLQGKSVAIIGIQKGRNTKEKVQRNFGMARPEGYRKALRIMRLAAQFNMPIVSFIDTPGAYPGIDAEERGQAEAIARCLLESFDIATPFVTCIIGEGGSGGALAIGCADVVIMQEYSTYSVISPESCASILWSDPGKAETAATIMRMTPNHIKPLGVIDHIVKEPTGGAHRDPDGAAKLLKATIVKELTRLSRMTDKKLLDARKKKFRAMGSAAILDMPIEKNPAANQQQGAI